MSVSEAKKKANHKYDAKAYTRAVVRIPKSIEEKFNTAVANSSRGSVNGYILDLIKKDLGIEFEVDNKE